MVNYKNLFISVLVLLTSHSNYSCGQSLNTIALNIQRKFETNGELLKYSIQYKLFESKLKRQILDTITTNYLESKNAKYSYCDGEETLLSDGMVILISNPMQTIAVIPLDKTSQPFSLSNFKPERIGNLITSKSLCKLLHSNNPNYQIIRSTESTNEYDSVDIVYNKNTYLLVKVCVYFNRYFVPSEGVRPNSYLELEYVKYSKKKVEQLPSALQTSTYIIKRENEFFPRGKYQKYELLE